MNTSKENYDVESVVEKLMDEVTTDLVEASENETLQALQEESPAVSVESGLLRAAAAVGVSPQMMYENMVAELEA